MVGAELRVKRGDRTQSGWKNKDFWNGKSVPQEGGQPRGRAFHADSVIIVVLEKGTSF